MVDLVPRVLIPSHNHHIFSMILFFLGKEKKEREGRRERKERRKKKKIYHWKKREKKKREKKKRREREREKRTLEGEEFVDRLHQENGLDFYDHFLTLPKSFFFVKFFEIQKEEDVNNSFSLCFFLRS